MLLHNGGHVQPNCYYPDPSYLPQHATPPPPHFDIDAFLCHPSAYQSYAATVPCHQAQQHPYYNHGASESYHHHHSAPYYGGSCTCGCPWKPVQETFLHKILTGKGYKNDAMCVNHHSHLAAGRSVDNVHYAPSHGPSADFAMAASCCYSGLSGLAMASTAFPPSIPGL